MLFNGVPVPTKEHLYHPLPKSSILTFDIVESPTVFESKTTPFSKSNKA